MQFRVVGLQLLGTMPHTFFGEIPEIRILSSNGRFTTTDLSADSLSRTIGELADGTRLSISAYSPFLIDLNIMDSPGWGAKDDDK